MVLRSSQVQGSLWRTLSVFRAATLLYAVVLLVYAWSDLARPGVAAAAMAGMAVWTVVVSREQLGWGGRRDRRVVAFLVADVVVACALILLTRVTETPLRISTDAPTLPAAWAAGCVLASAVAGRMRGGLAAAAAVGLADVLERRALTGTTTSNVVLLLLAATVVGYLVNAVGNAEAALATALAEQSAIRERDRLARVIHDGVLQVLSLVARSEPDTELGAAAGEQERALRSLVSSAPVVVPAGRVDVRPALLDVARRAAVEVETALPAYEVVLDRRTADELVAATAAALDNVARHAAATRAWLWLDDDDTMLTVGIRDDGRGFAAGRLTEAAGQQRQGVRQSIVGRLADLGGTAVITSTPDVGTEVELRLPRSR